jgi:putative transposase
MSGVTVGAALDRVLRGSPGPRSITVDHGAECQSRALEEWAYRCRVRFDFIRPGKPVDNVFIADAQTKIEAWRIDYNQRRPHGSLGHLTPNDFAELPQAARVVEEAVFSS